MSVGINELFKMLNWNSDEETQKKGIEEGSKVKCFSIFIQPLEDKGVWENCAKIIAQKSDEDLRSYLIFLLEWLKDANWPGFDIMYNRIKAMPAKLVCGAYAYSIRKAAGIEDEMWLVYLASLCENKELYESLSNKEKEIIDKHMKDGIEFIKNWHKYHVM